MGVIWTQNYDIPGVAAQRQPESLRAQPCFLGWFHQEKAGERLLDCHVRLRSCDLVRVEGAAIGVMKAEQSS